MKFIFDSHGGDRELNARTGQSVVVLRALTEQEADIFDVGKMFRMSAVTVCCTAPTSSYSVV